MDNELTKKLKAEHERHNKAVGKAIDEFGKKAEDGRDGSDNSETDKAIDEYKDAMESEHGEHLEKCMKAIDDSYDSFGRKPNDEKALKAIDEFKAEMKAEHLKHVKSCDKAIDEFKAGDDEDETKKAIDEFTKAMGDELERHEKAHEDMCKAEADKFGDGEEDGKSDEKAFADLIAKSGRAISAKNKEKLKAILEKMESHHNDVTAAIKELIGSEDGDGGEEPKKPDEKSGAAPELKVEHLGSTELEVYLFNQRLVRQVKTVTEVALRQMNEKVKELRASGR